jgi:hypothetical protein
MKKVANVHLSFEVKASGKLERKEEDTKVDGRERERERLKRRFFPGHDSSVRNILVQGWIESACPGFATQFLHLFLLLNPSRMILFFSPKRPFTFTSCITCRTVSSGTNFLLLPLRIPTPSSPSNPAHFLLHLLSQMLKSTV